MVQGKRSKKTLSGRSRSPNVRAAAIAALHARKTDKCRICWAPDFAVNMIRPCDCTSMVHAQCLDTWRALNGRAMQCEICRSQYAMKRVAPFRKMVQRFVECFQREWDRDPYTAYIVLLAPFFFSTGELFRFLYEFFTGLFYSVDTSTTGSNSFSSAFSPDRIFWSCYFGMFMLTWLVHFLFIMDFGFDRYFAMHLDIFFRRRSLVMPEFLKRSWSRISSFEIFIVLCSSLIAAICYMILFPLTYAIQTRKVFLLTWRNFIRDQTLWQVCTRTR